MFTFLLKEIDHEVEVQLEGDLDIDATEVVEDELKTSIEHFRSIHLNFKDVPFVDSSGIGLLLNLVQTLNEHENSVSISHLQEDVKDVFDLLQIPEILGECVFFKGDKSE